MAAERLTLRVTDVRAEAHGVLVLELRDPHGDLLPAFTAGAHLEIDLAPGITRHYSLCNDPFERDRYEIGVGLSPASRGGSKLIHHSIRVGASLQTSFPRNNFSLDDAAEEFVFIAGGIGITPIMAMIRDSVAKRKRWTLFYCARTRLRAAFAEDLDRLGCGHVHYHIDQENEGKVLDVGRVLDGISPAAHIYCCGPNPLMTAVEGAATRFPSSQVRFEWFSPKSIDEGSRPFAISIRSTGKRLDVPPGKSILDVLEENGMGVPFSCREGLCATCVVDVVSGVPDHRDSVLSEQERRTNRKIAVCVSRALSDSLELDL